jgi:ligand-binding SRPBCC domain-containing protein
MQLHSLEQEQVIPATLNEAWAFFSDPQNLGLLTPPYLNLRPLRAQNLTDIYTGMKIRYRVSPIMRIPLEWITEITEVQEGKCFTDEQLKGPYKLWRHRHVFEQHQNGVLMKDHVDYAVPLGIFGELAHSLFLERQLKAIFRYRRKRIEETFANNSHKTIMGDVK